MFLKVMNGKSIFLELFQESLVVDSLLYHIVRSKRLLADHIELLESCQLGSACSGYDGGKRSKKFTLLRTLGFLTLSIISMKIKSNSWNMMRYIVPVVASSYGICFTIKTVFTIKRKLLENAVFALTKNVDHADFAIRKNISYFRELKFINSQRSPTNGETDERVHKCLQSIIEIVRLLHEEVKVIESIVLPDHVESNYQKLEDLNDCVYFQRNISEFTADNIKDFYNIFLYFQSQFFLRLCLIIVHDKDEAFKYLRCRKSSLIQLLTLHIADLTNAINLADGGVTVKDKLAILYESNKVVEPLSVDLSKVKRSSADIFCRLMALTSEYRRADDNIQSIKQDCMVKNELLVKVAAQMNGIGQSLAACQDDYQRLVLTYDNFLKNKCHIIVERKVSLSIDNEFNSETEKENQCMSKDCDNDEDSSEYFALRDSKDVELSDDESDDSKSKTLKRTNYDDELENLDIKLARSFFAPVLEQLKTKINPIKDEMKEREIKFLMAQGIEREKIINWESEKRFSGGCDSDTDSDVDIVMPKSKTQRNYNEMRSFLEQKQQFKLIPPNFSIENTGSEDILE